MSFVVHPTAYAVVIVVTTLLATSLVQWAFLLGLKRRHRQQWNHAGNPTIWAIRALSVPGPRSATCNPEPIARRGAKPEFDTATDSGCLW